MSATIHELRQNLAATREQYGRRSSRTAEAFQALVRGAAEVGTPLDGLRHHVADETERFFSYTIPGPDGHVYWDGAKDFTRNDGKGRRPVRWWWVKKYDVLDSNDDLKNTCGDKACINPEHYTKERVRGTAIKWPEHRIIGSLQVMALRLGHTPNGMEFERLGGRPSRTIVAARFGSWENAIKAAGLPEAEWTSKWASRTDVLRGIQLVRRLLGKWPNEDDYKKFAKDLHEAGFPSTIRPAVRLYGSFPDARKAAGGHGSSQASRENPREETSTRKG